MISTANIRIRDMCMCVYTDGEVFRSSSGICPHMWYLFEIRLGMELFLNHVIGVSLSLVLLQ